MPLVISFYTQRYFCLMSFLFGLDIMKISLAGIFFVGYLATSIPTHAQITPDLSLPNQTKVTQVNNLFEISEGTKAGINLFHSFDTFSIPDNNVAQFINNDNSVQNVIGRVTGASSSEIFGKIESIGNSPNFNLFLINPKGIIFGPNATLSIGGSFVATTSNAIRFGDQGFLEISSPNDPSLLKINPTAFFFNKIRPQSITSQSSMVVPSGNSILLLGGNIELNGGNLQAPNGRVELGSLNGPGLVELNKNGGLLRLSFPNSVQRGNVSLTNKASVDVTDKGGGSIAINAQNIELSGGSVLYAGIASPLAENDPPTIADDVIPGAITLDATKEILIKGSGNEKFPSLIDNSALPHTIGRAGDISIASESLILENNVAIETDAFGAGDAGNVEINTRNGLILSSMDPSVNPPFILSGVATSGVGNSGNITVSAGSVSLSGGSAIRSSVLGRGNTGNILVYANDSIEIKDSSSNYTTQIRTVVEAGAIGNGGNIDIRARTLSLTGGGQLSAAVLGPDNGSLGGKGRGGNINVNTLDSVKLSGVGKVLFPEIGAVDIPSGIFADSELGANGPAGNIAITTNFLRIDDGAEIKLSNPQGQAGNLVINANRLTLNNSKINAETGGDGAIDGANIDLKISESLRLENESSISARASGNANGGNIKIDTPILLALPPKGPNGSDIIASAEFGKGGKITISAKGIFGINERKKVDGNRTNDIDASSLFGRSGQVDINTAIDPNNGLTELPETVVDPDTRVAQNPCNRGWGNELTVSGRGGLPPSPSQDLSSEATQIKLVEPVQASNGTPNNPVTQEKISSLNSGPEAIIAPAQGWVYNKKGQVVLVAYDPTITGAQRLKMSPAGCPVP
jgi:filamentous hemagglutinin family protein